MTKLLNWIKNNKLASLLLLIVGSYLFLNIAGTFFAVNTLNMAIPSPAFDGASSLGPQTSIGSKSRSGTESLSVPPINNDYAPTNASERMVIQETHLSMQVRDVGETVNSILQTTRQAGGYMVTSWLSNPDIPSATIVVRIPESRLAELLDTFKSYSINVVSENISGRDVTDQYVDLEERLQTYENSKQKFEAILENATEVEDITRLTREIINIQQSIDSIKGQQQYLQQNSELAKVTIYLSTDDLSLPYAPSDAFRPAVIFKLAVRSLLIFLRKLAAAAIWIGVFSVVWVPALLFIIFIRRLRRRSKDQVITK